MGKLKQNAKAGAQTIRDNKWISICVIILAAATVAVTLYLLFRPVEESPPESAAAPGVQTTTAPAPSAPVTVPGPTDSPAPPPPTSESDGAPVSATPTPAITPPAASGSPVSGSNIVLNPVPPPVEIDIP